VTPDPDEPFVDSKGKSRSKVYLEKKKLDLEISNLEKKNRSETLLAFIPLATVLLSVIGLGFGFWQFKRQQDAFVKEHDEQRAAQAQEQTAQYTKQLRSDIDEISKITQNKTPISRISFLLNDVRILLASTNSPVSSEASESYRKALTEAMTEQLVNDADFMKSPTDVIFANKIVESWDDYRDYLKKPERLGTLNIILYRYVRALRYLRGTNEAYFKDLSYDEGTKSLTLSDTAKNIQGAETLNQHSKHILEGFKEHLNLLPNDNNATTIKERQIRDFGDALCNEKVARYLLQTDFIPRPCMVQSSASLRNSRSH